MAGFFKKLVSGLTKTRDNIVHGIDLSLIHISEPTRRTPISYAVFCLKKKKKKTKQKKKNSSKNNKNKKI